MRRARKPQKPDKQYAISAGVVPILRKGEDLKFLLLRAFKYWDFPKGLVEKGEDPFEGAKRELAEETCITHVEFPWDKEFIETEPYSYGKIARYYAGEVHTDEVRIIANPEWGGVEHDEYRWVDYRSGRRLLVPRVQTILDWAEEKVTTPERFLIDENMAGLARWLRFFGFDALVARGWNDRDVANIAISDNRKLVTRDTELAREFSGSIVHVRTDVLKEQLIEVLRTVRSLNPRRWFSRCAECNFKLVELTQDEILLESRIPDFIKAHEDENQKRSWFCESCARVYWKGSHYDKTWKFLEEVAHDPALDRKPSTEPLHPPRPKQVDLG